MRRNLHIALESIGKTQHGIVSLEEEQVLIADAANLASEVNQELNECDRIVEISDALEDLAVVANQIEAATPTEIALIETAGDMAVAGTDIEPEEIVPALESFHGKRIATETFKERAAQIWKNIQEYLKKIWEKIEKFFYNVTGVIPNLRKRLDALEEKVKKSEHLTPRGTMFEVNTKTGGMRSIAHRLCVEGKAPRNDRETLINIQNVHEFSNFVFTANLVNRKELGEKIAKAIEDFDPAGDLEAQAKVIVAACDEFNAKQKMPGNVTSPSSSGSFNFIRTTPELVGGGSLAKKVFAQADGNNTLGAMERLRHSGIVFEFSQSANIADKVQFPIVTTKTIVEIINVARKILDNVEEYQRGAASKSIEKIRKQLESASQKATMACDKVTDQNSEVVRYCRAMLNFNAAYGRWVSNPAIAFTQYAMSEVNTYMAFIDLVLKSYEANQ